MILQGNQRGGAKNLALHLLKNENDHVEVHELRGFMSDDLVSALNEVYAVSRGTRANKFLFSLSLNPPGAEKVSTEVFKDAIKQVEEKLKLTGQPRAIVFHEKNARRHAHVVWSRIDTDGMKAIPLSFTKLKLMDISRDLYLKHGWTMPEGFIRGDERDPHNFTLEQWQQAKRIGKDPKAIKSTIRDCWAASDTQTAFQRALQEQGYFLANGSRKGAIVAIDQRCEVFSVPKWIGIRIKDVRAKLTDHEALPEVEDAKSQIAKDMTSRLSVLKKAQDTAINICVKAVKDDLGLLTERQKSEREKLMNTHEQRRMAETKERQNRFNKGLHGFIDRLTGKRHRIAEQNKQATKRAETRDQTEKDALIFEQLGQSRKLTARLDRLKDFEQKKQQTLSDDLAQYHEIKQGRQDMFEYNHRPSYNKPGFER